MKLKITMDNYLYFRTFLISNSGFYILFSDKNLTETDYKNQYPGKILWLFDLKVGV